MKTYNNWYSTHWLIDDHLMYCGIKETFGAKLADAPEHPHPFAVYGFCKNCLTGWLRKWGYNKPIKHE